MHQSVKQTELHMHKSPKSTHMESHGRESNPPVSPERDISFQTPKQENRQHKREFKCMGAIQHQSLSNAKLLHVPCFSRVSQALTRCHIHIQFTFQEFRHLWVWKKQVSARDQPSYNIEPTEGVNANTCFVVPEFSSCFSWRCFMFSPFVLGMQMQKSEVVNWPVDAVPPWDIAERITPGSRNTFIEGKSLPGGCKLYAVFDAIKSGWERSTCPITFFTHSNGIGKVIVGHICRTSRKVKHHHCCYWCCCSSCDPTRSVVRQFRELKGSVSWWYVALVMHVHRKCRSVDQEAKAFTKRPWVVWTKNWSSLVWKQNISVRNIIWCWHQMARGTEKIRITWIRKMHRRQLRNEFSGDKQFSTRQTKQERLVKLDVMIPL